MGMSLHMEQLALKWYEFDNKVVRFRRGGFKFNYHEKYTDAPKSVIYFSLRNVVRNPELRGELAGLMVGYVKTYEPEQIVDLPQSFTPLITTVSDMTKVPVISIRSEYLKGKTEKGHGVKSAIDGKFVPGQRVLIMDDILSGLAFTSLTAAKILLQNKLIVDRRIVKSIDREEGGAEFLGKYGYMAHCLYGLEEILRLYVKHRIIGESSFYEWKNRQAEIKKYVLFKT